MSKELLHLLGLRFQKQCRDNFVCLPPIQCLNTTSENVFCHMLAFEYFSLLSKWKGEHHIHRIEGRQLDTEIEFYYQYCI